MNTVPLPVAHMAHPLFDIYFASASEDRVNGGGRLGRQHATSDRSETSVRPVPSPEDARMVAQLRASDPAALDACVRRYGDAVVRVAQITTGSRDSAWDVAQEVFIELWRSRERLDVDRNLGGYLYRAARHRALDLVRREQSQSRTAHSALQEEGETAVVNLGDLSVDAAEFRERVHAVLRALPPRCAEIFLLHREAGLNYAEIEAVLGVSNATIRNQVSRATRHLARALAAGLFDDWLG